MNLPNFTVSLLSSLLLAACCSTTQACAQTLELPDAPSAMQVERVPVKRDLPYLLSRMFVAGGTTVDMMTTAKGLNHPTKAYKADGTLLCDYVTWEAMPPGSVAGRNTMGVVLLNVGLNAGVDYLDRRLYRGGHRKLAIAVNLLKGGANIAGAVHNIQENGSVDKRVRLATGYAGRIYWGNPPVTR